MLPGRCPPETATFCIVTRSRHERAVDRRFNRRRYDAARTIAAFSARLRDQVDLDTLAAELLTVVDQTTQPTQASLWLRPPQAPRSARVRSASTDPRVHQHSA